MKITKQKKAIYFNYISIVVSNLVNAVLAVFLVNLYSSADYGIYALITTITSAIILFDFGLSNAVIKFLSRYPLNSKIYRVLNAHLMMIFIIVLLVISSLLVVFYFFIPFYLSSQFTNEEIETFSVMFVWGSFIVIFNLINKYLIGLLSAIEKFNIIKFLELARVLLRLIGVCLLLLNQLPIVTFIIIDCVLSFMMMTTMILFNVKSRTVSYNFKILKRKYMKIILSHSLLVFIISLIDVFYWKSGQLILGSKFSAEVVAIYSIAMLLVQAILSFNHVLNSVTYPMINHEKNKKSVLREVYKKSALYQSKIVLLIMSGILIAGYSFYEVLFNKSYLDSIIIFNIIAIPLYFICSQSSLTFILFAINKHKFRAFTLLINSFFAVLFSLLVVEYGIYYLVLVLAIFLILGNVVIMNMYYYKILNISIKTTVTYLIGNNLFNIIMSLFFVLIASMAQDIIIGSILLIIYMSLYITLNYKKISNM